MKAGYCILALCVAAGLTGCESISKPYVMTVDRTDQKIEGNRGYLKGTPPPAQDRTGIKRELIAIDMNLVSLQGKPSQETVIVTKTGKKPIFPSSADSDDDKNVK